MNPKPPKAILLVVKILYVIAFLAFLDPLVSIFERSQQLIWGELIHELLGSLIFLGLAFGIRQGNRIARYFLILVALVVFSSVVIAIGFAGSTHSPSISGWLRLVLTITAGILLAFNDEIKKHFIKKT